MNLTQKFVKYAKITFSAEQMELYVRRSITLTTLSGTPNRPQTDKNQQ